MGNMLHESKISTANRVGWVNLPHVDAPQQTFLFSGCKNLDSISIRNRFNGNEIFFSLEALLFERFHCAFLHSDILSDLAKNL